MPITPFHYSVAYVLHRWRRELSLPALIIGSFTPDLEVPFYLAINFAPGRLVLHSIIGTITLGTLIATLITVYLYPILIPHLFKVDEKLVREKCGFSPKLVLACMIGCLFHVLLDSLHHQYNPLLYPITYKSFDALVLFGNPALATRVVQPTAFSMSALFILLELKRSSSGFWERVLVGS